MFPTHVGWGRGTSIVLTFWNSFRVNLSALSWRKVKYTPNNVDILKLKIWVNDKMGLSWDWNISTLFQSDRLQIVRSFPPPLCSSIGLRVNRTLIAFCLTWFVLFISKLIRLLTRRRGKGDARHKSALSTSRDLSQENGGRWGTWICSPYSPPPPLL